MKDLIITLRALTTAANSLRFNPEIDPNEALIFESRVYAVKALIESHPEILNENKE